MARKVVPFTIWKGLRAEYTRNVHHILMPSGWTKEEILDPGAWAHHLHHFKKHDLIEFEEEHGAYDMLVRVTEVGNGLIKFRVLWCVEDAVAVRDAKPLPPAQDKTPDGYKIDRTPRTGWRAVRIVDGIEVGRHYANRDEAISAAREHAGTSVAA